MKTNFLLPQSFSNEKRINNKSYEIHSSSSNGRFISLATTLKGVFILFILFACIKANAQTPPSSNIYGALKAYTSDTAIVITGQIAADVTPTVTFSIENNMTGASVLSQGTLTKDNSTGTYTQTIVLNPGGVRGTFNVALLVSTPSGTCESSKSVTVVTP